MQAGEKNAKARVYVVYDSWSMNTAAMARAVAEGARSVEGVDVVLQKVDKANGPELEAADAIVLGSPTHNRGVTGKMAGLMERMISGSFAGKIGGAFGSYGWSGGEAVQSLKGMMQDLNMEISGFEVRVLGTPKEQDLEACRDLGRQVATQALARHLNG